MHRLLACVLLAALATAGACGEDERARSDAELALERVDAAGDELAALFLDAATSSGESRKDATELARAKKALKELRLATREMEATVEERRVQTPADVTERIEDYLRFADGIVDRAEAVLAAGEFAKRPGAEVRRIDASLADMDEQRTEILDEFLAP